MAYYCYMVECADGSFYTGWTTDPRRRERQHNRGTGAAYTRMHGPVRLVYVEPQPDRKTAMKREMQIKRYSHQKKQKMAKNFNFEAPMPQTQLPDAKIFVTAPGRVNLLGEHIDYNGGAVLPAAIDRAVKISAAPRPGRSVRLHALDLGQSASFDLDHLEEKRDLEGKPLPGWARYPAGVAWALQRRGYSAPAFEAAFTSNIPIGSGLSSSAAIEVGFAALWQALGGWQATRMELAQISLEAEIQYVGLNCGLMDQFASANGVAGHVLYFNTSTLEFYPVPLPSGTVLVIANSSMRRSLTSSGYNERHAECEQALEILKTRLPGIHALCDVSPQELQQHAALLPEVIRKRAQHVVEECDRVERAVELLKAGDAAAFGELMYAGHASLRDLYEVSIPELDTLVALAAALPGCYGARLTGAGFGGCTVNLVAEERAESFVQGLKEGYLQATGRQAEVYLCHASDGVRVETENNQE